MAYIWDDSLVNSNLLATILPASHSVIKVPNTFTQTYTDSCFGRRFLLGLLIIKKNSARKKTHLHTVPVCRVHPTRWRDRNSIMREVNKHIHQVPVPNRESGWISTALYPFVIPVPSTHVMADKESRSGRQSNGMRWEWNGCFVKFVVEGLVIRFGFEVFEVLDRKRYRRRDIWHRTGRSTRGLIKKNILTVSLCKCV